MATVVPFAGFDAESDAEVLRKAMKGFGTDEKAIIEVIAHRSNAQRQEIKKMFKTMYGKDLIHDLKSELGGHFEDLVVALFTPIFEFEAECLKDATKGIGTTESVLIEIMCTRNNAHMEEIKKAYEAKYKKSLEDDISSDCSGHFKRLLVSLCQASRDESTEVNQEKAEQDAAKLYDAGQGKIGTDESVFNRIIALRSYPQLRATFDAYIKVAGYDIERAIEKEMSGDVEKAFLAVVKSSRAMDNFFAEQLYDSMHGMGTNDKKLIRFI
eukprot:Nk52_evm11s16 gene=Nk52_evmTU11s16